MFGSVLLFKRNDDCYSRSGSIILSYHFMFGATQDNDIAMMHTKVKEMIEENRGSLTASIEMGALESVGVTLGL